MKLIKLVGLLCTTLTAVLWTCGAQGQSINDCQALPYIGVTGPEICIRITQTNPTITPIYFRVPVVAGLAGPTITGVVAGEYTINTMTFAWASAPTGMSLGMTGTVTRTSPGNGTLSINALGGWGTAVTGGFGVITLTGSSTGTSNTKVGASAWEPAGTGPAQDVRSFGFPRSIDQNLYAPGTFQAALPPQPLPNGFTTVAIGLHTSFHLNAVGAMTGIPAGAGIAQPGSTAPELKEINGGNWPHFECYEVAQERTGDIRNVKLADQFATVEQKIRRITRLCTPVNKNDEGLPDPELHLVCYEILEGHKPNVQVETKNQFGKNDLLVKKAKELCVPSYKQVLKQEMEQKQEQKKK